MPITSQAKCHGIPCTMNDLFELDFSVQ